MGRSFQFRGDREGGEEEDEEEARGDRWRKIRFYKLVAQRDETSPDLQGARVRMSEVSDQQT